MEKSRLRDFFDKDLTIRVFSVLVAVILWANVSFVIDPQTQKEITNIPVKFVNEQILLDSGLTLTNKNYFVSVQIEGRRNIVSSINNERLWAEVDLANHTKLGTNKVNAKVNGLPSSVDIIKEPEELFIVLDKTHTIQKNISVSINGEPKEGFAVLQPVLKPASVKIEGAQNLINTIKDVTIIVDVSDLDNTFITKDKVDIIDKNGNSIKGLKANIDIVEVSVPIVKVKEVSIKSNLLGQPQKDVFLDKVTISPQKVLITANEETLNKTLELLTEGIDISGANNNIYTSTKIQLPKGVQVVNGLETVSVEILFKKPIMKTITLSPSDISLLNLSEKLKCEITSDKIWVTVEGLEENLINIKDKLQPRIDLKNQKPGDNSLPLIIELPEGVKLNTESIVVSVNISNIETP